MVAKDKDNNNINNISSNINNNTITIIVIIIIIIIVIIVVVVIIIIIIIIIIITRVESGDQVCNLIKSSGNLNAAMSQGNESAMSKSPIRGMVSAHDTAVPFEPSDTVKGIFSQLSQMLGPAPPALRDPSTWYDDVAAPHSRVAGGGVDKGAYSALASSAERHTPHSCVSLRDVVVPVRTEQPAHA
jgi:hypothetical protein